MRKKWVGFRQFINIQHKMVYGRILYNSIKEYTPKWFPTIPYSQTTKPVFGRQPQVVSVWNSKEQTKKGWRLFGKLFQYSWAYQIFMFGLCFGIWSAIYFPVLSIYQSNNKHRTFKVAMAKEKVYKKAQREKQLAEQAASRDSE